MASRMDKYYKSRDSKKRSIRNESLYQTIYEDEPYSNIEGVVATPKANEIDIETIKELIASREQKKSEEHKLVKPPREPEIEEFDLEDEKKYDIRDILVKAKDSRETKEDDHHSLKNTEYNILKNIKINNKRDPKQEEELKELINTVTSTSMLNKMTDKELSLNMFDDLTSDTMIGDSSSIQAILNETKEEMNKTGEMDNSFFTTGVNFKAKDFEQLQDLSDSIHKSNKLVRVIIVILLIVVLTVLGFVIFNFIKK